MVLVVYILILKKQIQGRRNNANETVTPPLPHHTTEILHYFQINIRILKNITYFILQFIQKQCRTIHCIILKKLIELYPMKCLYQVIQIKHVLFDVVVSQGSMWVYFCFWVAFVGDCIVRYTVRNVLFSPWFHSLNLDWARSTIHSVTSL